MITEHDLLEAIAECQGQRNPSANTCLKLASFYTILDHIQDTAQEPQNSPYSYESAEGKGFISFDSKTAFGEAIKGLEVDVVLSVVDELMDTLAVINPPLYRSVMRRLT